MGAFLSILVVFIDATLLLPVSVAVSYYIPSLFFSFLLQFPIIPVAVFRIAVDLYNLSFLQFITFPACVFWIAGDLDGLRFLIIPVFVSFQDRGFLL